MNGGWADRPAERAGSLSFVLMGPLKATLPEHKLTAARP